MALLAAFGSFTLLYGIRLIFSSELTRSLGIHPSHAAWVTNTITYVINIPAWFFFWQFLGRGWRSLMPWWVGAVSAFAAVGVASDLYDFLDLGGKGIGVLVADVSGHGVPAALIASMVKVAATSHLDCAERPAEFLTRMNQTLCGTLRRGFVTAVFARLDHRRREAVVASAGHPPPVLCRGAQALEIGGNGPLLGRFRSARYAEERVPLLGGDRLVLFTDGLLEARNREGEPLGDARLHAFLTRRRTLDNEELCDALLAELQRWTGSSFSLDDDLTLVVADVVAG